MFERFKNIAAPAIGLVDLCVPPQCTGCGAAIMDGTFCRDCSKSIDSAYYRCDVCAAPLPAVVPNNECSRCRGKRWRFQKVLTFGLYTGVLRELVIEMKLPQARTKRRIMGKLLSGIVRSRVEKLGREKPDCLVVPVPNHWSRRFSGAANTAWEIAQSLADGTGLSCKSGMIHRIRRTAKQGTLAWSERTANVSGAFAVKDARKITGRHVFLVDDVFTSGSTAAELSKVLLKAGADSVDVVVVARGTGAKDLGAN